MTRAAAWVALLLVSASGCGPGPRPEARAPAFEPAGQSKCRVKKSSDRPLVIEWPSADRAALESTAKRGLVVVRYSGCEMEVLPRCKLGASYRYTPTTRKLEKVSIRDADELYAQVPVGAAKLEGKLEKAGELTVAMHVVGRYDAVEPDKPELEGACEGATHVVTAMTAGAFEFFAGAEATTGGGAGLLGAGAGRPARRRRDRPPPAQGLAGTTVIALRMAVPAPSSVRVLAGKYALLRPLGEGATGTVFEAENLLVGRKVAVKVLAPHLAERQDLQAAFLGEARSAARVAHPNVVEVLDVGRDREGVPFIVMELLNGETLAEILRARGPLPVPYAAELTLQILAAVCAAHEQGIIHRDLKPANVMVTHPRPDQPLVKVLDFGIAQGLVSADQDALACAGTPLYMPPEQALGKPLDPRADVYSVCAIFYELVTGRPPFDLDTSDAVLRASLAGRFTPLAHAVRGIHPALSSGIDAGLSADRSRRPPSAAALAEILAPFADPIASSRIRRSARSLEPIPLVRHGRVEADPDPEWQPPPPRRWLAPLLWAGLGFAAGVGLCAGLLSGG